MVIVDKWAQISTRFVQNHCWMWNQNYLDKIYGMEWASYDTARIKANSFQKGTEESSYVLHYNVLYVEANDWGEVLVSAGSIENLYKLETESSCSAIWVSDLECKYQE